MCLEKYKTARLRGNRRGAENAKKEPPMTKDEQQRKLRLKTHLDKTNYDEHVDYPEKTL